MKLRQAVVSSSNSRVLRQNELIGRSDFIDNGLAHALCQRSPQRNELAFGQHESINFFQADNDTLALSRSVAGGMENSRGNGRRVVSHIVVFHRDQLCGYHNNIALMAGVLRSMGSLTLQTSVSAELPLLEVPDHSFQQPSEQSPSEFSSETERILHAIDIHRQVIILGLKNPLSFLCSFLNELPLASRLDISFATGLQVIDDRPFTLQFFPVADQNFAQELASRQLRTISLERLQDSHA